MSAARRAASHISLAGARDREMPEKLPQVIDQLLPFGASIWWGAPKCGKSTLALETEMCLSLGMRLGGVVAGDVFRCYVVDMEGSPEQTVNTSRRAARHGTLATDGQGLDAEDPDGAHVTEYRFDDKYGCREFEGRLTALRAVLQDAAGRGIPFRYVRLDTLRRFFGPPPQGRNQAQYDSDTAGQLNELAKDFGVAILVIHHPNKANEMSGSVALAGAVEAIFEFVADKDKNEGLLKSHGYRPDADRDWPILRDPVRGTWDFTDTLNVVQVANIGQRRQVADYLTKEGRATASDIAKGTGLTREAVKPVLQRLRWAGQVMLDSETRWSLIDPETGEAPAPAVPPPPRAGYRCQACGEIMAVIVAGQVFHPCCEPEPEPEVSRETPGGFNAYRKMDEVLKSSKLHPQWFISEADRESGPWPHAVQASWVAGHAHRWKAPAADFFEDRRVLALDRHQSYPGSCNGVPVAPGKLEHTGACTNPKDEKLAGICEVVVPGWEHEARIGHPLGRDAVPGQSLWVPSGQVELLWKLFTAGEISRPIVVDSWMGRRTTSLFDDYQVAVRDARAAASTPEEMKAVKLHTSVAIRKLHPKEARSQWWRPDWHAAICAEAATRLWVVAWAAVKYGDTLASMGNTDAVSWFAPDGKPDWLPSGYKLGDGPGTYHVVES